jgi:molybdopterin adenylyltransferase
VRTAILIVSTSASRRSAPDEVGPALAAQVEEAGGEIVGIEVVPHDYALIEDRLHHFVEDDCGLVLTAGGIGADPDHVTPEATRAVIERDAPGFAEAMRTEGARHTPMGILTRGVSGVAGQTLIVNFPGSPKAIDQLFGVLEPTLAHVVQTLRGDSSHGH